MPVKKTEFKPIEPPKREAVDKPTAIRWGGKKGVKEGFELTGELIKDSGYFTNRFGNPTRVLTFDTGTEKVSCFVPAGLRDMIDQIKKPIGKSFRIVYDGKDDDGHHCFSVGVK